MSEVGGYAEEVCQLIQPDKTVLSETFAPASGGIVAEVHAHPVTRMAVGAACRDEAIPLPASFKLMDDRCGHRFHKALTVWFRTPERPPARKRDRWWSLRKGQKLRQSILPLRVVTHQGAVRTLTPWFGVPGPDQPHAMCHRHRRVSLQMFRQPVQDPVGAAQVSGGRRKSPKSMIPPSTADDR